MFSPMFVLRSATPEDVRDLFELILALARYERLEDDVTGNPEQLHEHLFGSRPFAEAIVAEVESEIVGLALFFPTYSTFKTQPGLRLEDLFVRPEFRGRGIGTALIQAVAALVGDRGYAYLEWTVLDWNAPAIHFYQKLGATILPDWRICRLSDRPLSELVRTPIAPDK